MLLIMKPEKKIFPLAIYLVLIMSTLLVYWQAYNFDFVNYDDNLYVYQNPHVLSGFNVNNIVWAFTTGHTGYWHPLTWLSLMLNCELFGCAAGWIHLINIFIHIANVLLLFAILKKLPLQFGPAHLSPPCLRFTRCMSNLWHGLQNARMF
jgi:hypothetical protein